jgi:anti-sigma-K factor RskA
MADEQNGKSAKYWKMMTSASTVAAAVALFWGLSQQQKVAELSAAKAELSAEKNSIIAEANAKIAELSKRDLPITVSFRSALLGSGLVGVFKNHSSSSLEVAAVMSSPTTNQEKRANLVIPANGSQEIGHAEGWPFAAGHRIKLSNGNYRDIEYTVPE